MTTDLEHDVRRTLNQHAGPAWFPPMPASAPRRIRVRRGAAILAVAVGVVSPLAAVLGVARLAVGPDGTTPAAEQTAPIPSPSVPGQVLWTPPPFADLEPGAWPEVTTGDVDLPYIDRVTGEELDKAVLTTGHVEGLEWSLTGFAARDRTCAELFLGDWGDNGGVRVCRTSAEVLGAGGASFGTGPVTAYLGLVDPAVDRVVFRFRDGDERSVELLDGGSALGGRAFVLFVPNEAAGRIVALTAGRDVASQALCVGGPAPPEDVTGCGDGLESTHSAVASDPRGGTADGQ